MTPRASETELRSFVPVAPESHFPIQNLPFGVFRRRSGGEGRVGTAIGTFILDLAVLEEQGLLKTAGLPQDGIFNRPSLNRFMSLGRTAWQKVRATLQHLLREDVPTLRDNEPLRRRAHQCGYHVSWAGQCAATQLALVTGGLPRARQFHCAKRHAGAPPQRAVDAAGGQTAGVRAFPLAGL